MVQSGNNPYCSIASSTGSGEQGSAEAAQQLLVYGKALAQQVWAHPSVDEDIHWPSTSRTPKDINAHPLRRNSILTL